MTTNKFDKIVSASEMTAFSYYRNINCIEVFIRFKVQIQRHIFKQFIKQKQGRFDIIQQSIIY